MNKIATLLLSVCLIPFVLLGLNKSWYEDSFDEREKDSTTEGEDDE